MKHLNLKEMKFRSRAELDFLEDFSVQARDLVLAPGILDENGNETTGTVFNVQGRRIQYSDNIDTVGGQSGSPVWQTLEGDDPRVLAVHSRGGGFRNAGTLIDTEAYKLIMDEIEGDEDPALLPENLIYGSDPISRPIPLPDLPGDDLIEGKYRKERILGLAGNDTIFGAGADDYAPRSRPISLKVMKVMTSLMAEQGTTELQVVVTTI